MIHIRPFRAIRPPRDKAYLVATRSYLSYNEEELDEKLNNNPYTFLHIINPRKGRSLPFGKTKYKLVKEGFDDFKRQLIFDQDETPAYYLYRQVKDGNEYIGLIGAVAVEDYLNGKIKKHEKTLTQRERMFTDYLQETAFSAEPVLLTYRDDFRLNEMFATCITERAEYEFTSTDRVLHQLWLIKDKKQHALIKKVFSEQEALYIADGHHRSASSAALAKRNASQQLKLKGADHFMAFLIGEEQMKIYEFNRLVKGLNGLTVDSLLQRLQEHFIVEPKQKQVFKPEYLHEIGMYVDGNWYKLVPKTGTFNPGHPVKHLDADILSENILKPILGITNLKTDTRVGFSPGVESAESICEKIDNKVYDIAFILFPTGIAQIKQVADANKTMPPKSTYVEPKLRSGLIVYDIED
jgi:uncharacterized protein (DUF1015 family)